MAVHLDLLAKLLASENIDIVHSNVQTASFDVQSRILTIPQWEDMSDQIETMLIAHEVGHCLFTPLDLVVDKTSPKPYRNVIEDVRIEQKIKSMFPGLKKDFNTGYKELNDKDFFGVKTLELAKLNLIDRINLYFKVGSTCGVIFTNKEQFLVDKVIKCDTANDVIALAAEIYQYSKADYESEKDQSTLQKKNNPIFDSIEESDDEGELDGIKGSDDEGELDGIKGSDDEGELDDGLQVRTQNLFDENLKDTIDNNLKTLTHTLSLTDGYASAIIKYQDILDVSDSYPNPNINITSIKQFKLTSNNYVNSLVKEFEMKKSAARYNRSVTAKTGTLDTNKLHAYRLTDNIFKSIQVVTDDTNHGMIFLLDWSASMHNMIEDTVKQVINLSMFCRRANIKFQVFAFTTRFSDTKINIHETIDGGHFNLLELFNNNMPNLKFNKMVDFLLSKPWLYNFKMGLTHTPLNVSLLYMTDYINIFIKGNNIEKMSLVILTDGVSDRLYTDPDYGVKHKIWDSKRKKTYTLNNNAEDQTKVLLTIIKDRYNIPILGFYITPISKRTVFSFISTYMNSVHMMADIDKILKDVRSDGAYICKSYVYDQLYLIPSTKGHQDTQLQLKDNMTPTAISKSMGRCLRRDKRSRVVLNKFISQIC